MSHNSSKDLVEKSNDGSFITSRFRQKSISELKCESNRSDIQPQKVISGLIQWIPVHSDSVRRYKPEEAIRSKTYFDQLDSC